MIAAAHNVGTTRQHPAVTGVPPMTLADIMTFPVTTVPADYPVHWALTTMRGQRISALVVVDGGRAVGIFTERDAVRFAAQHRDAETVPVSEAMRTPPLTAPADMDFHDAFRLITEHGVRHLIVTDDSNPVAGIVSEADIVSRLASIESLAGVAVDEVMTRGPVTLPEDERVREAVRLMANRHLGCIVVERHGRPVGIVTERDLVRLGDEGIDVVLTRISQIMSHPVQTVTGGTPLLDAVARMDQAQTRRLVVVDADGHTAGIVTRHDIVKALRD